MTMLSKFVGQLDDTIDKQPLDALLRELYHEALSVE